MALCFRALVTAFNVVFLMTSENKVDDEVDEDEVGRGVEGSGYWKFYKGRLYKAGKVGRTTRYKRNLAGIPEEL